MPGEGTGDPAGPPPPVPPEDRQREAEPKPARVGRLVIWSALVAAVLTTWMVLVGTHVIGRTPAPAPTGTETPLTGTTAEKVRAAALAAVPGATVGRVETDLSGSPYEAHVKKADGTEVVVKVDAAFRVTEVVTGPGG